MAFDVHKTACDKMDFLSIKLQCQCELKLWFCSPKTYHSAREPKSSTYTLSLGEQPRIECVRCGATQSHGGECDEAVIALHRCVLFVFLQPDVSGDSRRGSEEGGRERGSLRRVRRI